MIWAKFKDFESSILSRNLNLYQNFTVFVCFTIFVIDIYRSHWGWKFDGTDTSTNWIF